MLKFRPSNLTQRRASISFNELQLIALIEKGLSDSSLRGFLYKRSSPNAKWRMKWFLLFENLLFYFDVNTGSSGGSSHGQQQNHATQQASSSSSKQQQQQQSGPSKSPSSRAGSALSQLITRRQNKQQPSSKDTTRRNKDEPRRASADCAASSPVVTSVADDSPGSNLVRNLQGRSSAGLVGTGPGAGAAALSTGDLSNLVTGCGSCSANHSAVKSKTQNSSSISGVSGHFLAHNEQTIGRSTTTTAGKLATSSANYASLLNRKIGVLFLEGSYCERLVDSGGNFTDHVNGMPIGSRPACGSAQIQCTNVCLEMETLRHYNEFGPANNNNSNGPAGSGNKSSNSLTNSICNTANNNAASSNNSNTTISSGGAHEDSGFNCIFTLKWRKEGSKEYQFRCETETECHTWVHAISNARYSTLLNDKEQLEQKYLHLSQIIESESTAKWQYSRQCEELSTEIKKLRQEICLLKRQESRSNHLKLVLGKSAAIIEQLMRQREQQQQQRRRPSNAQTAPSATATATTTKATATGAGEQPAAVAALWGSPLAPVQQIRAGCPLDRVRSMDQEQEEHEVAVRRTRRCNTSNLLRLASLDPDRMQPLQCRYGGASAQQARHSTAAASKGEKSLARSATRAALPAGDCRLRASGQQPPRPPSAGAHTLQEAAAAASWPLRRSSSGGELPAEADRGADGSQPEVDEQALTMELKTMVEALNNGGMFGLSGSLLELEAENSEEIRKIKKVQGFFRGWLCRRRWKQIVQEYIKSPHAESMRKRNNLVFRMVECEEEYVEQLTLLISAFLRPIKMTASSQRPALDHDELNSIFLNSETLLFLHQIFLKGLTARMESWPTLILGDLFNMLLPMLTIYQEYVRNHHFSLQVLAECKQRDQFSSILRRLEEKPQLNGRTLETFLTYPMHQIPRYIICLHEILAHTPHNHVERKGLYEAQTKLEDLSRQMHDEVSETENIRQNLAIERMIIGGCDILLDVNQVFVRQGILLQVVEQTKAGKGRSRLASFASRQSNKQQQQQQQQQQCQQQQSQQQQSHPSSASPFYQQTDFNAQFAQIINSGGGHQPHVTTFCDNQQQQQHQTTKDLIRQCFLFTNHLLLCTRTKDGKLHLLENFGRISLSEVTLIENPLEFVQQQQQQNHHPADHRGPASNFAAAADCYQSPSDFGPSSLQHTDGATHAGPPNEDKRTSEASSVATDKWTSQQQPSHRKASDKRNSHVEFDLDYRVGSVCSASAGLHCQLSSPPGSRRPNGSGHYSSSALCDDQPSVSPRRKQSTTGSSRRRLAGYLANKLSNLTNLAGGGGGSGQLQVSQSSSAPPSPLKGAAAGERAHGQQLAGCSPGAQVGGSNSKRSTSGSISTLLKGTGPANCQQLQFHYGLSSFYLPKDYGGCDFILIIEPTSNLSCGSNSGSQTNSSSAANSNHPIVIHLVAPNLQEKAAWMSDISQCIDNVHFNDLFHGSVNDSSSVTINQSVRTDPRLYKDDVDIKFSRALNSCKLPQIRYASKERLFERLTDLRFLSIDFLNTFLLTYRVFTSAEDVLEALKSVHYNCERYYQQQQQANQQHLQQQHQNQDLSRDSFSAFANTSLNSLNTNTITSEQANDESGDQKSPQVLSRLDEQPAQVETGDKDKPTKPSQVVHLQSGGSELQLQQKPSIPPRSLNAAEVSTGTCRMPAEQQPIKSKFLMAPSAGQAQKRRSTISALTPITGSNSSSLANLAMYKSGVSEQTSPTNQTTLHAPGSSCPTSAASSLCRTSESHSMGSNNLEDLLALRLSEDESDLLSPPDGIAISCDRMRSSSMTQAARTHLRPGDARGSATTKLDVPTCRQVRASSLSHVSDPRLVVGGSLVDRISGAGNEHWRLSYKKATAERSGKPASNTAMSHLAIGPPSAATRRASSSDVTFHVTLDPPPPPPPPAALVEPNQEDKILSVGSHDDKLDTAILPPSPVVPPSTPIPPASPLPPENKQICQVNLKQQPLKSHRSASKKHHRRGRRTTGRVDGAHSSDSSGDDQDELAVSTASSSSSSSLEYADTKSVISSQSESELIHSSTSSSNLSSPADRSVPPLGGQFKQPPVRIPNGHLSSGDHRSRPRASFRQKATRQESPLQPEERKLLQRQQTKREKRLAQKLIIKEIDLTEAKVFDCDTSADEDKVSTSSGTEESAEEPDNLFPIDNDDDDDDRSYLILTRLNSAREEKSPRRTEKLSQAASDDSETEEASLHERREKQTNGLANKPLVISQTPSDSDGAQPAAREDEDTQKGSTREVSDLGFGQMGQKTPERRRSDAHGKDKPTVENNNLVVQSNSASDEPKEALQQPPEAPSRGVQTPVTPELSMNSGVSQRSIASAQTIVGGLNSTASPSSRMTTPRSSFQQQHETSSDRISKAGVIVSSSTPRVSSRRSSTASAASAFAAATAAAHNPILTQPPAFMKLPGGQQVRAAASERLNFDYNNLQFDCLCSNFHRASVTSCQSGQPNSTASGQPILRSMVQPRPPNDLPGHRQLHQPHQQLLHYPSCIYYQQQQVAANSPSNTPSNSYPNPHSDASSICNSRASSRLSSCAGLEYSSYSSAPVNALHSAASQQQQFNQTARVGHSGAGSRLGGTGGAHSSNEQSIASQMMQAGRFQSANSARGSASKRNSTQINVRSVATIRVLSVLRHWVSKHSQDFVNDTKLSYLVQEFLQDLIMDTNLLPAEHKAALQLQQMVQKAAHSRGTQVDLDLLLAAPARPSPDSIESLSALEIAEGMTYLDHKIFLAIRSEEFLGQAWMKMDKAIKAPHILLITKRFNDVSRLVSSEIIRVPELHRRVAIIEKWTNVAHICRVVHNFNGVLQICAAFTNSAVFRLKKTWDKLPKTTKTTIDQLQNLVSTDSRFRNMRDAINRCDPPSIPYVGMYLTDLSFIEEGTPNYSPDGLLNFSKMRMIAHVIREIQHLQNGSYKIELNHRVANYLLDASRHLQDDEMYRCSLAIEPRSSGAKNGVQILNSVSNQYNGSNQQQANQQQQQQQQSAQSIASTPVKSPNPSKN